MGVIGTLSWLASLTIAATSCVVWGSGDGVLAGKGFAVVFVDVGQPALVAFELLAPFVAVKNVGRANDLAERFDERFHIAVVHDFNMGVLGEWVVIPAQTATGKRLLTKTQRYRKNHKGISIYKLFFVVHCVP